MSASRVALAVANEWKDENDRVMPVKQWLEERRLLHVLLFTYTTKKYTVTGLYGKHECCFVEICVCVQGEMQKLKDKLAVSERTAKAESQLKVIAYIVIFC